VDQSQAAVKRAEADFKPDWGVNLTYQQREAGRNAPFGGDDWVSGGVSLSIPLWAGKKQQPDLRAAQAEHSAALARVTAVSRLMKSEWTRWDTRRLNAQENIVILDAKILKLEEQIDAQLITYESGDGDYAPVLDAEIAILNLRAQRIAQTVARDQSITMMNSLLVTQ
jgi:outer membrane protein TolC